MSFIGGNNDFVEFSFEREFNLLYAQVNPTIRTGITKSKKQVQKNKISNLAIYEIGKEKLSYFFEEGSINNIKFYFYESTYNEKLERIDFNTENYVLSNNRKIEKRKLTDKLFVVTENEVGDEYKLWISSKLGTDKKMVKEFSKEIEWSIDVYNKKILFLHKVENGIKIESLNW